MKKMILTLALAATTALAACGGGGTAATTAAPTTTAAPETTAPETKAPETTAAPETTEAETTAPETTEAETTAAETKADAADTDAVEEEELLAEVAEVIDGAIGEEEKITGVALEDGDLVIKVDMAGVTGPIPAADIAESRVSSITDNLLEMEDKYTRSWQNVIVDFGSLGKATLTPDMIVDGDFGKYYEFEPGILKR